MRFAFYLFLLFVTSAGTTAQSRRVVPQQPGNQQIAASQDQRPVKEMLDEAGGYLRVKAAEFDAKKVRLSDAGLAQLRLEQKQLAARYAGQAGQRKNLAGEDYYYLGMLHWLAENFDGASESLTKFVGIEGMTPERVQTARSVLVVSLTRKKDLAAAEKILAEYAKNEPQKLTERAKMAGEIARAYRARKEFVAMEPHAAEAYASAKKLLADATSYARGLDEILDAGMLLVDAQRGASKHDQALATLDDMGAAATSAQSPSFYHNAVDNKIRYLNDLGKRAEAKTFFDSAIASANKSFTSREQRDDAVRRLKVREKHYSLLGLKAPAMPAFDQWLPGKPKTLDDLKGKVVLIDFWAIWCTPCIEAFPSIREWNEDFRSQGFEILGVTRYYGEVRGLPADKESELAYLKRFRATHNLPYDFVVMDNQSMQLTYGATSLPTAVLIDRKGIVRYIEAGTSSARLRDLRDAIERLIAEQ